MRKQIYDIINQTHTGEESKLGQVYNVAMMIFIMASLLPILFKQDYFFLQLIDKICAVVFILDYILRLLTADIKYNKRSVISFIRYPFSAWGIIDIISILPSLTPLNKGLKVLRVFRMGRLMRTFRIFKAFRFSKNFTILKNVLLRSKTSFITVGAMAAVYIFLSAIIIFNVEPDTFNTFFDAIYWATISLTTVGYGDIYAVTVAGKVVTMFSAIFGIAIIALPAGVVTAELLAELEENQKKNK